MNSRALRALRYVAACIALATILIAVIKAKTALPFRAAVAAGRPGNGQLTAQSIVPSNAVGLARSRHIVESYGKLPLSFEVNRGQTDPSVQFIGRGQGQELFLGPCEAVLVLKEVSPLALSSKSAAPHDIFPLGMLLSEGRESEVSQRRENDESNIWESVLRMALVGARQEVRGAGVDELPGKANYFVGNNPANWITDIKTYSKVKYSDVYPGIDIVYYDNSQQLEYDFMVTPGSDPRRIKMDFQGADRISIEKSTGDLILAIDKREIRLKKPAVYQIDRGTGTTGKRQKHLVEGRYDVDENGRVGFEVAAYDRSKPLVIDPVLSYFTYLGGMLPDFALGIAVDSSGDAYVTGATVSPNFPVSSGALRATLLVSICGPGSNGTFGHRQFPCPDAFVTKLNSTGTAAIYSTYLGGGRSDLGVGIAVDSSGNAYVVGETESTDFPTTSSGFQNGTLPRLARAFLTKLNAAGSQILYSTYLGGTTGIFNTASDSGATAVAIDNSGDAYVGGYTRSPSFPTTPGVVQPSDGGGTCRLGAQNGFPGPFCSDGFVSKLNTNGSGPSSLVYSTYLGGNNHDVVAGIAVDGSGNAYLSGTTLSTNFPTAHAFQAASAGGQCGPPWKHPCSSAFVAKLNSAATAFVFSTYLGGSADNAATGIAVDSNGNAYVTGLTNSTNFPTTTGVAQPSHSAASCFFGAVFVECPDAFVAKFSSTGSRIYSTYLGGTGADVGFSVAADSQGNAYVTGTTNSTNFPTSGPFQANFGGGTCTFGTHGGVRSSFTCPDVFVTKLDPTGGTLLFSSYLGGNNADIGTGIALDASSNIYITGATMSTGLATPGAFQSTPSGMGDAFVAKIGSIVDFSLSVVSGGSSSATVTAGNAATYNLQVNPIGGFSGSIIITCTGAPAQATCMPSTSPISVNSAGAVPFTVNVTTKKGSFVSPGGIRELRPQARNLPVTITLFFLLIVLTVYEWVVVHGAKAVRSFVHAAILVIGLTALLTACGSGGGGGGTPGTPTGTSTLTVTGTSGGASHTQTLTLTVN